MYDMSHKNGNISMPFRRGKETNESSSEKRHHFKKHSNSVDFMGHIPRTTRKMENRITLDAISTGNINVMPGTTKSMNTGD